MLEKLSIISVYNLFQKLWRKRLSRIIKATQLPRIFIYKTLSDATIKGQPSLTQPLHAVGHGSIEFIGNVKIGIFPSPLFFSTYAYIEARNKTASITFGDGTCINNGFSAIAEYTSINIGRNVLIGTNVEIYDSDFHGLEMKDRKKSGEKWARSIEIGDNVYIGSNVKILKGVKIGQNSVIANSTVVVKDIPSDVIAGGNPVRVLRKLET